MENKYIIILIVFGVFIIGIILLTNIGASKEEVTKVYNKEMLPETSGFMKEDFNNKYGIITISKSNSKEAEYSLTSVLEDILNLEMQGRATLYQDGALFDTTVFKDKNKDNSNLKEYQYYILVTKDNYINVPETYKEQCEIIPANKINKTEELRFCSEVPDTYRQENQPIQVWEKYNGEILNAGDYKWKFEGKREIGQTLDIIPVKENKEFSEWVWFNTTFDSKLNISNLTGAYSFINLSYIAGMNADFSDLRFTDSSETVELPYFVENKLNSIYVILRIFNNYNTTIVMYYNNSSAVLTKSNFATTYGATSIAYLMDEGSGTNLTDFANIGNLANNGTMYNTPAWVNGKVGQALKFVAASQENIKVGDASNTNYYWNFTLAYWYNNTGTADFYRTLTRDSGLADSDVKFRTADGTCSYGASLYTKYVEATYKPATDNAWHYQVCTANGTHVSIFVDGVLRAITANPTSATYTTTSVQTWIGKRNSGDIYYTGTIDEVMFMNRTITPREVLNLNNTYTPNYIVGTSEQQPIVEDTCTYSGSGSWYISCNDFCNITTIISLVGNNIQINGTGRLTMNGGNFTNVGNITRYGPSCNITRYNGGRLR